ncbi:MAG TPA: hypothetical protein VFO55_14270 [Gemmatimonadaceae bacterium]|nr:hypothetical protein [Gemmatimonadaceae bacterium]
MPLSIGRALLSLVAASVTAGVPFAARAQPAQQQGNPKRVIARGTWQIIREIGRDNDLIEDPGMVSMGANRIVIYDYGTNSVKSIRLDGTLEWNVGRAGRGPGEYASPTSLVVDSAGRALVYDPDNGRLTILDRTGRLARAIPLRQRVDIALPGRSMDRYLLLSPGSDTLAAIIDSAGNLRRQLALPVNLRNIAPIAREIIAVAPTGAGYLLAFRWSSRMLLMDAGGSIIRDCTAIDSLSFPARRQSRLTVQGIKVRVDRVDPAATEAVLSVARLDSSVAVLRESTSRRGARQVDIYASACGRYVETRPFPFVAGRIVGTGNIVVAVVLEPSPHLAVLRWVPSGR